MKEVTELYAKILIGTFSFIGPSFTLLIAVSFQAIEKSRLRHRAHVRHMTDIVNSETINHHAISKEFAKLLKENRKELNLLMPRRQMLRWALSLGMSITMLQLYYFQHSSFWPKNFNYISIRILAVALSIIFFVACLYVLWQVFCTIIKCKREEEEAKINKTKGRQSVLKNAPILFK